MLKAGTEEHLSHRAQINLYLARFCVTFARSEIAVLTALPRVGHAMIFKEAHGTTLHKQKHIVIKAVPCQPSRFSQIC